MRRRRLSRLCTALALAVLSQVVAAASTSVPAPTPTPASAPASGPAPGIGDAPVPERAPDAPPVGLRLAPGVTLSGYGTVQLLAPLGTSAGDAGGSPDARGGDPQSTRRTRLNLSHASAIAWWEPAPAWKALVEVDVQDLLQLPAHDEADDGPDSSRYVALDRLYVDYRASDSVALRVGKFLTPIGRWNQEHSDPQTWTVSRPLLSESAFPASATGLMVFGSMPAGSQWVDYQLWASDGDDLRTSPRSDPFRHAVGVRVATSLDPDLQLGLSASRFTESGQANTEYGLVGVDALWRWRRAEWSAEALVRHGADGNDSQEHGWFLQAATPFSERWWVVARVEAYRRAFDVATRRSAVLGVVYRSGAHWVFKAEWAQPSDRSVGLPSGLLSSITLEY